ncbi:MAG: epoxyqueuosine reductase [Bacillota bacterium]|nr:epoxyqueuosine reductase [Bacillota bacterium]
MIEKEELLKKMSDFTMEEPLNYLEKGFRIFDFPLIGFCRANDPIFKEMKKEHIIGSIFLSPEEWFPGAVTVISYFLPFTAEVRCTNRSGEITSVEWLHGSFKGEKFNLKLRRFIIQELEADGWRALAPALESNYLIEHKMFRSNWSERHVAYAEGLGTFGLNRGLITEKGMSGRFGSIITDIEYPPTVRKYNGPFEYCLNNRNGSCGACIERCPAGAITEAGMEKAICRSYLHVDDCLKEIRQKFGYPYSACGKCQTIFPCEEEIPKF